MRPSYAWLIFFALITAAYSSQSLTVRSTTNDSSHHEEDPKIKVAKWNWDHVGLYLTITAFVVLSGLAKVGFHYTHFISSRIPESCLLILVGVIMGAIIYYGELTSEKFVFPEFSSELFFFFLLPPIILESAFSLYDRAFFDNLATILVMAVVGTAINFLMIGFLLFAVFKFGAMGKLRFSIEDGDSFTDENYDLGILETLLFSSLISAVDPVAVLAIFQEVGVNPDLYFLVFGESLLNDGVAVVLYNMMNTFNTMQFDNIPIDATNIALGLVSFLTISLGGLTVGIIVGLASALITRTTSQVRVVEPLAILGMAYLAYIMSELFGWSGIISLIGCGLIQAHYSFKNISKKSYTTVKYFIKMASSTCDTIIFLFLGIALVKGDKKWHTGFIIWTLCFCLICRFIAVYGLTFLANKRRVKKINLQEQFIMAYGGLRGAVGFSLVEMISRETVPPKTIFLTSMLATVVFTVFFQGGTIKFLVDLLGIDRKSDSERLVSDEVNETVMEYLMSGIEIISGHRGHMYFGNVLSHFDEKVLMKIFCNPSKESDLLKLYEKLSLADHLCNLYGPTIVQEDHKGQYLLNREDLDEDSSSSQGKPNDLSGSPDSQKRLLLEDSGGTGDGTSPPPVPPRVLRTQSINQQSSFFNEGLRPRSRTESITVGLAIPPDRSRRPSREDISAIRQALRDAPFARYHQRHNPNLINDDDQEISSLLQKRHSTARKISQIVMSSPTASHHNAHRLTKHFSLIQQEPESTGDAYMQNQLLKVPTQERLAVQAVLARHGRRVRSMSMSSARSGISGNIPPNTLATPESSNQQAATDLLPPSSPTESHGSSTSSGPQRPRRLRPTSSPSPSAQRQEIAMNLLHLSPVRETEESGSKEEL